MTDNSNMTTEEAIEILQNLIDFHRDEYENNLEIENIALNFLREKNNGIDYNKLLDDWAEKIYKRESIIAAKQDNVEFESRKYGYLQGIREGYIDSITVLSIEERKAKKNIENLKE